MRKKKQNRPWLSGVLALLLLCALFPQRGAAAGQKQVVRVGFPIQEGLTELTADGKPTGYTYEYLQEIAQYTGWEYEFVILEGDLDETLSQSLEMLRRGEIDIMGAMNYSPALEELYSYPSESCGTAYSMLAVLDSNTAITESNYAMKDVLRIAVSERATARNQQLERFCEASHVNAEFIYCGSSVEQLEKLRSGEADAILGVDISIEDGMRQIARFSPTPFYFATTKGNIGIITKLNRAIAEINKADPYFEVTLHEAYFGHKGDGLRLTGEEEAYIAGKDTLRVAVMRDKAPIQDVDPDTGEFVGVAREVFDYIAEHTGLHFQYVIVDTSDDLARVLQEGRVDLAAGISYDYGTADFYDVALGRPYLESQIVMVLGGNADAANLTDRRLALTKGVTYSGQFMGQLSWYDSVPESIRAVEEGRADYSYGNSYMAQYYTDLNHYRNITLVPQSGLMQQFCIGVARPVDGTLLTILNKAVISLPTNELQSMIYRNAVAEREITLGNFVEANPLTAVFAVAAAATFMIGAVVIYYKARMRYTRRMAVENERYLQLCELSNEHIYEYDYEKDRLTLSEKSAQALGVPQVQEQFRMKLLQEETAFRRQIRAIFLQLEERREASDDIRCSLPNGGKHWFRVTGKLISDKAGKPVLSIGKLVDIQEEKEERERLMDRAQRDSLTNLYNAAAIRQLVGEHLTRFKGRGALLIIDIDHFKEVNDQFGHYAGDQVLVALARLLEDVFRRGDIVGRLGGDEFVVFMDNISDDDVVAAKCKLLLQEATCLPGLPVGLTVTLSVGCAMARGCLDYNQLYQRADKGLYAIKRRGRNGFEIR